ncbi:hypothetical protein [Enterococcus sp. 5B3_DIV0040]|uniref:hypothetical protein n=1 Tax=Enterococcus sp. 5B3_DIV0040 TaxID=1834182 RepID=UPI000A3320E2|nr:hypothetical protein [Enterococcus sp. 5B3_DIV0040]OTO05126.1 hypothetical protein A5883_002116 [Enterococcus sp. 5B3_DIV0040]
MNQEINGCVQVEKQGNHVSIISEELDGCDILGIMLFSVVSIAKDEGIDLRQIRHIIDGLDQHLEFEECEQKHD